MPGEMLEHDEHRLIDAARGGSVDAFEDLYRLHCPRVYGLCLRISRNEADAQDCTQETFVTAWQRLDSFRSESALSTWLHRIAVNVVLSRKRKTAIETRHLALVDCEPGAEPVTPDGIEALEQAIRGLPDRTREAFVLNKIYGYTHEEVAEMLAVAAGTSKALVHRARQILSVELGEGQPGAGDGSSELSDRGRKRR